MHAVYRDRNKHLVNVQAMFHKAAQCLCPSISSSYSLTFINVYSYITAYKLAEAFTAGIANVNIKSFRIRMH